MDLMPNNQNGNQQNTPGNNQNNPNMNPNNTPNMNPNNMPNNGWEQPPYYGYPKVPVDPNMTPNMTHDPNWWPTEDYRYLGTYPNWMPRYEGEPWRTDDRTTPYYDNKIVPYPRRNSRVRMTANPIGFRTSDADSDTYNRILRNSVYMNNNMPEQEYLVEHITEELEGANDYMAKALEWKMKNPTISKKFYKMAETEVEHANCLTKMFTSMKQSEDISDEEYNKMYKEILRAYEDEMNKLESAKKLYRS